MEPGLQGSNPEATTASGSEERYQLLFEQSPAGLFQYDLELRVTEANRSLMTILDTDRERLIGLDMSKLRDQRVVPAIRAPLAGQRGRYEGPYRATTSDAEVWISLQSVPFHDAAGRVVGGIGIVENVTARRQAEAIRAAVYEISEAVYATHDLDALFCSIHGVLARLMPAENCFLALYDAETDTVDFAYFVDGHDPRPPPRKAGRGLTEMVLRAGEPLLASGDDLRRLGAEGRIALAGAIPTSFLGAPLRTEKGPLGVLALQSYDPEVRFDEGQRDVLAFVAVQVAMAVERKRHEAQIARMAFFDALTGLENRRMLQEHAARLLAGAQRRSARLALLYLDLDRFKNVNDTLGHDAGDELLRQIAHHLHGQVRRSDVLARLGGDEFAILLDEADSAEAEASARRLLRALDRPFEVRGQRLHIGGSVGIALFPDHGTTLEILLKNADIAMYRIKASGGGFAFFDAVRSPYSRRRLEVEAALRQCLADGSDLHLLFQPIRDARSGDLAGVEALVRWQHGGQLLPACDFVPLAEESDLVRRLDAFVLGEALRRASGSGELGRRLPISVNLSTRSLHGEGLAATVAEALRAHGLTAGGLVLEITESAAIRDIEASRRVLASLRALGVHLAVDDFGSGFASLTTLRSLPFDWLKIDRDLVRDIGVDPRSERLLESTIALGRGLDLSVVAEGVETDEQLTWLRRAGCDLVQGYLLGRPQELDEALKPFPPAAD